MCFVSFFKYIIIILRAQDTTQFQKISVHKNHKIHMQNKIE